MSSKITERIRQKALELLEDNPDGLRYSELLDRIAAADNAFKRNTISGSIWNLDAIQPDKVYKPSKGLYRLTQFRDRGLEAGDSANVAPPIPSAGKVREQDFYEPFRDWLEKEVEDVTKAIALGGNKFRDKWGTPDVIGKRESRRSDIVKGPTEIVSAEIKPDANQLVTAFGQACSYKIFSHKVYLVVPNEASGASRDEISRLDSLCQIFGIGLVTFDAANPQVPDFRILVRPVRHEPDLFYTNKYMALIEKDLFD